MASSFLSNSQISIQNCSSNNKNHVYNSVYNSDALIINITRQRGTSYTYASGAGILALALVLSGFSGLIQDSKIGDRDGKPILSK